MRPVAGQAMLADHENDNQPDRSDRPPHLGARFFARLVEKVQPLG